MKKLLTIIFIFIISFYFINVKAEEIEDVTIEDNNISIIEDEKEVLDLPVQEVEEEKEEDSIQEETSTSELELIEEASNDVVVEEPKEEVVEQEKVEEPKEEKKEEPKEEIKEEIKVEQDNIVQEEKVQEEGYKVYFKYNGYKANILGGEKLFISNLLNSLNINIDLSDILDVRVSNNSLFTVSKMINNDYAINSIKSFDTEEKIYIDLLDGSEYIIDVTDPVGEAPEHNKTLTPNGEIVKDSDGSDIFEEDGTYKLSLTVTGEADITTNVSSANILIIYDVSSSMTHYWALNATGSIGGTGDWSSGSNDTSNGSYGYFRLYKKDGDGYLRLDLDEEYEGTVYRKESESKYVEYTGNRYLTRRAEAGETTLNKFIHSLFEYQDKNNQDNIEVAFIQFANGFTSEESPGYVEGKAIGTKTVETWTNKETDITKHLTNSIVEKNCKMNYMSGTNYESALQQAISELNIADGDPTHIIFITDGEPSQSVTTGNVTDYIDGEPAKDEKGRKAFARDALDEIATIANYNTKTHTVDPDNKNTSFYGVYAFGKEFDFLDDLVYYANKGYERPDDEGGVTGSTVKTDNYYNASNMEELNDAVSHIFYKIISSLGIADTTIVDGTTSSVKLDSGDISSEGLLDVDDTSFEYYLSWHVDNTSEVNEYTFTIYNEFEEGEYTYLVSINNDDVVINRSDTPDVKSNYKGTLIDNVLRVLWGDYNERLETNFYYAAPQASFINDSVEWDLKDLGTLLKGVTYEVTFDVWPSQTTYDLIADLKNGAVKYNDLSNEVRTYLIKENVNDSDKEASYTLLTNTIGNAYITYNDKRTDKGLQKSEYIQPQPVATSSTKMLSVNKIYKAVFKDDAEEQKEVSGVELWVTRDGIARYKVNLDKKDDKYTGEVYISVGVITEHNGELIMKTSGRDYAFVEKGSNAYHWELDSETLRPMLINNKLTLLKKVNEEVDGGYIIIKITTSEGDNYKIIRSGETYNPQSGETVEYSYYEASVLTTASLSSTMTNEYRSNLDIVKTVTGESSDDKTFDFKIQVTSAESTNVDDEFVWFSVADTKSGSWNPIEVETDAILEIKDGSPTYYYYAKSGLVFDEDGKLSSKGEGTTFTVKMKDGYSLRIRNILSGSTYTIEEVLPSDYVLTITGSDNTSFTKVSDSIVTGEIEATDTVYKITYTNNSQLTKVTVVKTWDDESNQDGKRKDTEAKVQLLANNNPYLDPVEVGLDDEWTYVWHDLPVYDNNELIIYSIEELLKDDTYSYLISDPLEAKMEDSGIITITNSYTPELRDINIIKVWTDFDNEYETRPVSIIVYLYNEDTLVKEVTLNEECEWKTTIYDLPVYSEGSLIKYRVEEEKIDLYEPVITGDMDKGFNIENFYSPKGGEEVPPHNNPQTSDNLIINIILLLISITGLIIPLKYRRYNHNN